MLSLLAASDSHATLATERSMSGPSFGSPALTAGDQRFTARALATPCRGQARQAEVAR